MGRRGLLVAALLTPLALVLLPRIALVGPQRRVPEVAPGARPVGAASAKAASSDASVASGLGSGMDPNLPLFVGQSRLLAARAIDDTAAAGHQAALVALGFRFLGTPARPSPAGSPAAERLVLDLSGFDGVGFPEQLVALVNSRQVRTRTEAVDRFSDHVRRLRYGRGLVDPCARLRQPRLWALAAARRGYLVDLTPFLPGARLHLVPLKQLLDPSPAGTTQASGPPAICHQPGPGAVQLAELPLEAVPAAAPSLRSGDLFVLVRRTPDRHDAIGLVVLKHGRLGALLVRPGRGVVHEPDLLALARNQPGSIGVSFLRSLPNADGLPDP